MLEPGGLTALLSLSLLLHAHSYNIHTQDPVVLNGPNRTFFGYSVLLHTYQHQSWLLVGAPVSDSQYNSSVRQPGAVYSCDLATRETNCTQIDFGTSVQCGLGCEGEAEDQWLGVSLTGRHSDGLISVCGHRWRTSETHQPLGVCYQLQADLLSFSPLVPCYTDNLDEDYANCQAGTDNFLFKDLLVLGAPGMSYWTGSVMVHNTSSHVTSVYLDTDGIVHSGSYLGYSVAAGAFLSADSVEVVGGAPQHQQTGKVYVFRIDGSYLSIISEVMGSEMGSYFGASVCAVDLNADGLSDLLVGAPMATGTMATGVAREEGRVHVYINQGEAVLQELAVLSGSQSHASRFGSTMVDLGDIDDDGYPDVAVGAPQEDEMSGAVYIYNGRRSGLEPHYSQRIAGSGFGLQMFGQSISGGIDVDHNGYHDIAIGAFLSDSAVVLRTRAVVVVEALLLLPASVNRTHDLCDPTHSHTHSQGAVCVNATICFMVRGQHVNGSIEMLYNLSADIKHRANLQPRFLFPSTNHTTLPTNNITNGRIRARLGHMTCTTHHAFLQKDVRDIFSPIVFQLQYRLGHHQAPTDRGRSDSIFLPLRPVLQRDAQLNNTLTNQTVFARYCVWPNCSSNLQLSAMLALPRSHGGVPYVALGEGKTIILTVTLSNAGDTAFLPTLHLSYPPQLHFIRTLQEKVQTERGERRRAEQQLICSVGNLFLNPLAKVNISFLMDVSPDSLPGDLNITVTASRENFESDDLLHDNTVNVTIPLRYGVDLNIHGIVSRKEFSFGDVEDPRCQTKRFNYTFKVVNVGPSVSFGTRVEISLPRRLSPHTHTLATILTLQSSMGRCYSVSSSGTPSRPDTHQRRNSTKSLLMPVNPTHSPTTSTSDGTSSSGTNLSYWSKGTTLGHYWTNLTSVPYNWLSPPNPTNGSGALEKGAGCELPSPSFLDQLFFLFSKKTQRRMYCMVADNQCLHVVCELGTMATGSDATVHMEVELRPGVLDTAPGRQGLMSMEASASVFPNRHPDTWFLQTDPTAVVVLDAHHSYKMAPDVKLFLLLASLLLGLLILTAMVYGLWKSGFFRRRLQERMTRSPLLPAACRSVLEQDT